MIDKTNHWGPFLLGSAGIIFISRQTLVHPHSHGFYRFFAWEILLGMFVLNVEGWFYDPLAWNQMISWVFLAAAIVFVVLGLRLLRTSGQPDSQRKDPELLSLEKTSRLVTAGLYKYIRHPLYSSLFFLGWGMFFKSPTWLGIVMHGLDLVHILAGLLFPGVSVVLMRIAGPLYMVWFPMLARDLFRLGRDK